MALGKQVTNSDPGRTSTSGLLQIKLKKNRSTCVATTQTYRLDSEQPPSPSEESDKAGMEAVSEFLYRSMALELVLVIRGLDRTVGNEYRTGADVGNDDLDGSSFFGALTRT